MTSFAIRPATDADADAIARVHVGTWRHAYAGIMPDDYLAALDEAAWARQRRERLANPVAGYRTMVAVRDGEVVGFATFGPYRTNGTFDHDIGEVVAIYVDPPYQGGGAGRALMDAAVAALGGREIRLWVLEENAPSRRFYERYGLAADGTRDTFRVTAAGEPVDLPEVRYILPARQGE